MECRKADEQAAWTLVHMSGEILDAETANNLRIQRRKIEEKNRLLVPQETIENRPWPPRPPTEALAAIIGRCSEPFERDLTSSDLDDRLCKLTLTTNRVHELLLPMLNRGEEDIVAGIEVTTYDWKGKGFPMTFKTWNENKLYVLTSGWKSLCKAHVKTMKPSDKLVVWMFRHRQTKKLCFALRLIKSTITVNPSSATYRRPDHDHDHDHDHDNDNSLNVYQRISKNQRGTQ